MARPRSIDLYVFICLALLCASAGASEYTYGTSRESAGPPHAELDLSASEPLDLGADGEVELDLPFAFPWYGDEQERVRVGADGVLLFGETGDVGDPSCPADGGAWSGVAALWGDLDEGDVRSAIFGRYPFRAFAVEWRAPDAAAGGEGRAQAWLLEGRDQVVIALGDLTFSDESGVTSADGGAAAVIGVSGGGEGLAWSCEGGLEDGLSAWFEPFAGLPAAPERSTSDLSTWAGVETFQYAGRSLAAGDLEGDGWGDLVIGDQVEDEVYVVLGGPGRAGGSLSDADALILGTSGDDLGAALALGDMDGDGALELAMGAPSSDTAATGAGAVYVLSGAALPPEVALPDDADLALFGPSGLGKPALGTALVAADLDGDGYADLAVGGSRADTAATDAGGVWLWPGGADVVSDSASLSEAAVVLQGESVQDQAGRALAAGDLDGDGAAELFVGAPQVDSEAGLSNAGRVYAVAGEPRETGGSLADIATFSVTGEAADDYLGLAMAAGDIDGDGDSDLIAGAPYADGEASKSGVAYVFLGAGALTGSLLASEADVTVSGTETSANLGSTILTFELDGDGREDLVLAAPNATGELADAGVIAVFTELGSGALTSEDADHLLLGADSAGAAGSAIAAVEDHDGDGSPDLVVGAPNASPGGLSRAGAVYTWSFVPSYLDADGDGFVSVAAGGLDCDDGDAETWPGNAEVEGSGADEDCDGWIDGVVVARAVADWWAWDVDLELGGTSPARFDFEDAVLGEDVDGLYLDDALILEADGDITATGSVWGSLPSGTAGARVLAGSSGNGLTLRFGAEVDALSLAILDAEDPLELEAWSGDERLVSGLRFEAPGEDRTGGAFAGFTFARGVDEVRIESSTDDAWGIDDLDVVWADDTDRDGDAWTDNGGDCDDADPAVNPDVEEILGNGLDDDCDGVVDGGGLDVFTDPASWEAAFGEEPTVVDFEDASAGELVTDRYMDLGVWFEDAIEVASDVDSSAPVGTLAGAWSGSTLTIAFDELQPGVALTVLDAAGDLAFTGEVDGETLYSFSVDLGAEDTDGGAFFGVLFDYGVEKLSITSDSTFDVLGLDDLSFAPLGRDDADGDGYTEDEGDCDDHDALARPGGEETYYDGVDGDCDGGSDYDADGDGYDESGYGGPDCDDSSAETHPGAEETYYDGVDGDCDGWSDYDADGDGHDDEAWGGDDCDDGDEGISPDAEETYYDGVDSDCDGASDYDADGDGFVPASYSGAISGDSTVTVGDCDDASDLSFPGAEDEAYDGVDSDCGGGSDYDADGDGHDALEHGGDDCDDGDELAYPGSEWERCYDNEDSDCAGDSDWDCDRDGEALSGHGGEDCDDRDPEVHPGAEDAPRDGVDSDCDGSLEFDDDADGWDGVEDGGQDCDDDDPAVNPGVEETCYDGLDADCDGWSDDDCDKDGFDATEAGGADCADLDASIRPGAVDYYYDGIDNDCDGEEDFDADGDGWPSDWYGGTDCDDADATIHPEAEETWYDGVDGDCAGDDDYDQDADGVRAVTSGGNDCDDTDPDIGPTETEIPLDGTDQDCDGIDDVDEDGDGVLSALDCDDAATTVFPGAAETCYDGVDQDCDGADTTDCDGDGVDALVVGGADCDDADADVYPGGVETWYDGVDQDCAGDDDYDQDGDGFTIGSLGGADCDDTDAGVSPGVPLDGCGAGDEDCDGRDDEDCQWSELDTALSEDDPEEDTAVDPVGETGGQEDTAGEGSGGDTGVSGGPGGPTDVDPIEPVCGCSAGPPRPGLAALLLLGLLARRQRKGA